MAPIRLPIMICPHCQLNIHLGTKRTQLPGSSHPINGVNEGWIAEYGRCPACQEIIVYLLVGPVTHQGANFFMNTTQERKIMVWPQSGEVSCPAEVPDEFKEDFLEAARVLPISAKASAALSRRCLQSLLIKHANVKAKDLHDQIEEAMQSLPAHIADQLHAVRHIGNFAAHPLKNKATGEIVPVEPHEAEWNLEVLRDLFDHYFVKPEALKKRREDLNPKLIAAGKKPLT